MSTTHSLSRPRYELKYVLPGTDATRFLASIRGNLVEDRHATGGGYWVDSLYYDTHDFDAYDEKLEGEDPRYKVRIRRYGGGALPRDDERVYVEIKHRHDVMIHKDRVSLPAGLVTPPPRGDPLALVVLNRGHSPDPRQAERVATHLLERSVVPVCGVRYFRRAFGSPINPTLRVTLDTSLRASGPGGSGVGLFLPATHCVLELKYHHAIPLWLRDATRQAGLTSRRYSKYCSAIERLYPSVGRRAVRLSPLR